MRKCAINHQVLPIPDHQGPPLTHQPVHLASLEARGLERTQSSYKNQHRFNISFLGWGLKGTYNSDFFEKLRTPPMGFQMSEF